MATFTLDDLRAAADKKYAPTIVEAGDETFTLPTLLRMDADTRTKITKMISKAEELVGEDESAEDLDAEIQLFSDLVVEAEANGKGERLLELIGGDVAVLVDLVTAWLKDSQAGEA